jgi:hypothetical protein
MLKQAESPDATPEQLLQFCELEMQRSRARRKTGRNRVALLTAVLLVMMILAMGALMLLFSMLRDLPRPEHAEAAGRDSSPARFFSITESRHVLC